MNFFKTRKAAAKRFKLTGNNKLVHYKTKMSHLLAHESSTVKRHRRGASVISSENSTRIKKMLAL